MKLKNILFYTFFIITSTLTCTLATTDRMQETLTQETANQIKNKKASFYEYDVLDYLCTYKLTSMIMTVIHYVAYFATFIVLDFFLNKNYTVILDVLKIVIVKSFYQGEDSITIPISIGIIIGLFVLIQTAIALLWATLFRDGVNSFTKRIVFWLKNMLIRGTLIVIMFICLVFSDIVFQNDTAHILIHLVFVVLHIGGYIAIWIYPEKAKSILYGFSTKISKAKGASK